jgi:hypothetical protein
MPRRIMYYEDHFVVLSPERTEQFMTFGELKLLLHSLLESLPEVALPRDLQHFATRDGQVQRLIETVCELDCGDRGVWQWYAVRLDPEA